MLSWDLVDPMPKDTRKNLYLDISTHHQVNRKLLRLLTLLSNIIFPKNQILKN